MWYQMKQLKLDGSFIDVMSTFFEIFQAFRRGKLLNLWQNTCEIIFLIHECITWTLIHAVSHVMSWNTFKNLRWNHINIFIFQKCRMYSHYAIWNKASITKWSVVELYEQGGIVCFQKASFNNNYTEKENGTRCCDHGCLVNKKWFKGLWKYLCF